MPIDLAAIANRSSRIGRVVAVALAAAFVMSAVAKAETPPEDPKAQIVIMYSLQMAPSVCQWKDAADGAKLNEKVTEMEKALSVSEEEKTKFKAAAETDLKKPGNCTDGMARAMYDEMAK